MLRERKKKKNRRVWGGGILAAGLVRMDRQQRLLFEGKKQTNQGFRVGGVEGGGERENL